MQGASSKPGFARVNAWTVTVFASSDVSVRSKSSQAPVPTHIDSVLPSAESNVQFAAWTVGACVVDRVTIHRTTPTTATTTATRARAISSKLPATRSERGYCNADSLMTASGTVSLLDMSEIQLTATWMLPPGFSAPESLVIIR